jgi:polyether ionophore transport system permease protein
MTAPAAVARSWRSGFVGTGPLIRLAARRDRVLVTVWLLVLLAVCFASATSTSSLYATEAERITAAQAINASPGLVALYGPILDVHSLGELAMTKMTVLYAVFVAVMTLFVVRRHTRLDEENGQAELLGGTAIGHEAQLNAAVLFGSAVSVLLGALAALVNILGGLPAAGSVAFGAAWAGTGLVGVGVTALACQLSASSRTCAGIAAGSIGGLFVLRAVGDTSRASFLSWLTPFGWNTQLRAYSDTRWPVLLLHLAAAATLIQAARMVHNRRDLNSGVVAARPGPANGSPRLRDALALALRLHAPMLAWWTVAVAVLGLTFGAISPSFDAFNSDAVRQMFQRIGGQGAFRDMLLAAVASVSALVITCFGITVVTHAGNDEQDGRTEQVLATATSRTRVFLATVLVAVAGSTVLLAVTGIGLALGVGNSSTHSFGTLTLAAVGQAPAVWVVIGIAALLLAANNRWAPLSWAVLVLFASLGEIGELLNLPSWALTLSPYTHIAKLPVESFDVGSAVALTAIAFALAALAWLKYRARDIA